MTLFSRATVPHLSPRVSCRLSQKKYNWRNSAKVIKIEFIRKQAVVILNFITHIPKKQFLNACVCACLQVCHVSRFGIYDLAGQACKCRLHKFDCIYHSSRRKHVMLFRWSLKMLVGVEEHFCTGTFLTTTTSTSTLRTTTATSTLRTTTTTSTSSYLCDCSSN